MIFKESFQIKNKLALQISKSLAFILNIKESDVMVSSNEEKYYEQAKPYQITEVVQQVFLLMKKLNNKGIQDEKLGTTEYCNVSFRKILNSIINDVVDVTKDKSMQYVELGPEPVKTSQILKILIERNKNINRYIGIDINPSSKDIMKYEVGKFLPKDKINFYNILFENLKNTNFSTDNTVNLVTMLGFEEGNIHPHNIQKMLDDTLKTGDLFLSEMQLLSKKDWSPIFNFYQSDEMREFSKLTLQRVYPNAQSEYGVFLIPINIEGFGEVRVAVTAEKILNYHELNDKIFITNYCIKYTNEDYIKIREQTGKFKVIAQRTTSDNSIAFQLVKRMED
jgi:hypothetical protein